MALSGTFKNNFSNGYGLELDWSATQNVTNNTSTITGRLYWCSYSSHHTVYSSATKASSITIDGTWNGTSASGMASLSGNQRKLIHTFSKTVSHNSDGTRAVGVSGIFDCAVTLNGTYFASVTVGGTAYLNTIPRASTLSSNISFTAGTQNLALTINRASSSFTHWVSLYVQNPSGTWEYIGEISGIGASYTWALNSTHVTRIYTALKQNTSRPAKITLDTYSGGTKIGRTEKTGTVYANNAGYIGFSNFNIGDSIPSKIYNYSSLFTYNAVFRFGSFSKTFSNVGGTPTLTFTASEIQTMYAQVPNSNYGTGVVDVYTYYNGVQVRSYVQSGFRAYVTNSNPAFGTGYTYADTNSTTNGITGNNQYIIQNKSTVRVTIPLASRALSG